jgi:predicted nucleic acid-binding protein
MAGLVVDSSIALSWCLPGEDETDQIQREVAEEGAIVPSHWPLEVANALLMAERRQRITTAFRSAALQDLGALPIILDDETSARAWRETLQLAETYRLTAYDAAYVELAHRRALPLATLDAELRLAAHALGITLIEGQGTTGGRSSKSAVIVSMASVVEIRIALEAVSIATS